MPGKRLTALIRAYQADPYKPPEEREKQRLLISNAYRALSSMPGHPSIVGVRDFFPSEAEDKYFLVTEDMPGQALRVHIEKPTLALTLDQKIRIADDLLNGARASSEQTTLFTATSRHRTSSSAPTGASASPALTSRDPALDHSRTIAHEIVDDLEPKYMAPEIHGEPGQPRPSPTFSASVLCSTSSSWASRLQNRDGALRAEGRVRREAQRAAPRATQRAFTSGSRSSAPSSPTAAHPLRWL